MSAQIPEKDNKFLSAIGFDVIRLIHSGKFGTVFLANCNSKAIRYVQIPEESSLWSTKSHYSQRPQPRLSGDQWVFAGNQCAIKMIRIPERSGSKYAVDVDKEVKILIKLNHRHVVKIYDAVISDNQRLYVVMEYTQIGTLQQFVKKCVESSRNINEERVRAYVKQLIAGLRYLHESGVVHGDIHAGNVMLFDDRGSRSSDPILKYVDFGASTLVGETITDKPRWAKNDVQCLSRIITVFISITNASAQVITELQDFARSIRTKLTVNDVVKQYPWVASN